MKIRVSMLMFLGVLLTGYSLAQVQTDCSTSGTSEDGRISTSTSCTSTDIGEEQRRHQEELQRRQEQQQEANRQLETGLNNAFSNAMLRHKIKKGIQKYCDQHPGEPSQWQQNGQVVWRGTCPGTRIWTKAQIVDVLNANAKNEHDKDGKIAYTEAVEDKLITHSERASAMRFHATVTTWGNTPQILSALRTAGFSTYIYTNDADQTFKFDVANNREVTADTTAAADTPQRVAAPAMATPAATVAPAAPPH